MYYAPYPLRNNKSDWWAVIKTKPIGQVEVENILQTLYQNEIQINHQLVDVELVDGLNHPENIFEKVNIAEEEAELVGDEETFEEGEWFSGESSEDEDQLCRLYLLCIDVFMLCTIYLYVSCLRLICNILFKFVVSTFS